MQIGDCTVSFTNPMVEAFENYVCFDNSQEREIESVSFFVIAN